jgi:methionyl-tRNA formyltransferase
MPSDSDRLLRWEEGVDQVLKVVRAFGKFESTAILGESEWMVTDAAGWKESHVRRPGEVVHRLGREVVVAVSDGYVLLRHYHRELDFSKP